MSDWQIGDLALCIKERRYRDEEGAVDDIGPETGSVHVVEDIAVCQHAPWNGLVGLKFGPWEFYYNQRGFRKIRPDEHEACEEEFVTLLKRSKKPAHA